MDLVFSSKNNRRMLKMAKIKVVWEAAKWRPSGAKG